MTPRTRFLAAVVLIFTLAGPSLAWAQEYIFWGEYQTGNIRRANIDGTGVTTIATGQAENWGATVDPINRRVYWAPYGFAVRGSNFDGTGLTTVQTFAIRGEGVAVNPLTNNVYFNYYDPNGSAGNLGNGIDYAKGDGSEGPTSGHHLYDDPDITADTSLAIDWDGGVIYEGRSGSIYKAPLNGSGALTAMPNITTPYIHGMTLDLVHAKVYWSAGASIYSANLDGTGTTSVVSSTLFNVHGLAYNRYNDKLYFVQDGNGGSDPAGVYSMPITGGATTLLVDLSGPAVYPRGLAIFVPEPASLGLLALGGVMLLRRGRKA